jgi:hypothetical protein
MTIPRVPRLVAMITAPAGADPARFEAILERACAAIAARLDGRAAIRAAVLNEENPLAGVVGDRAGPTPDDAVIEVTLPEGDALERLLTGAAGLGRDLDGMIDPAQSTLMVGMAYLVIAGDANIFVALGARRDPAIRVEDMRHWWLNQHAPLVKKTIRPPPAGYEQLHVDRELSEQACRAAGLAWEPFDLFDSINVHTVADFIASTGDPKIQQTLLEDEIGKVDHSRNRGAFCRVVHRI